MRLMMLNNGKKFPLPYALLDDNLYYPLDKIMDKAAQGGIIEANYNYSLDDIFRSPDPERVIEFIEESCIKSDGNEISSVKHALPLVNGDLICVGRNYAAHARELNNPIPSEPVLFMKPGLCRIGSGENIRLPEDSISVEYEGELGLVIGHTIQGIINDRHAEKAVSGITLVNDITDRGKQKQLKDSGKPWLAAKGRPTFAPIGADVYPIRDIHEIEELEFVLEHNGEVKQKGYVKDWLWSPVELIRVIAGITGLRAGDIVATGTPAGVAKILKGDDIAIRCEIIGTLRNTVV